MARKKYQYIKSSMNTGVSTEVEMMDFFGEIYDEAKRIIKERIRQDNGEDYYDYLDRIEPHVLDLVDDMHEETETDKGLVIGNYRYIIRRIA